MERAPCVDDGRVCDVDDVCVCACVSVCISLSHGVLDHAHCRVCVCRVGTHRTHVRCFLHEDVEQHDHGLLFCVLGSGVCVCVCVCMCVRVDEDQVGVGESYGECVC
jgi:hypothetical protein